MMMSKGNKTKNRKGTRRPNVLFIESLADDYIPVVIGVAIEDIEPETELLTIYGKVSIKIIIGILELL